MNDYFTVILSPAFLSMCQHHRGAAVLSCIYKRPYRRYEFGVQEYMDAEHFDAYCIKVILYKGEA